MKVGIFSDAHYSSKLLTCQKRRNSLSLGKIKQMYDVFTNEKCELVISLGDLIDTERSHELEIKHLREIGELIFSYNIPTVCMMGNHDAFAFEKEEFYSVLGGYRPHTQRIGNKLLLFLDACYFKTGQHYSPGDSDWTDTFLPREDELKSQISLHQGEVILFIHQNIDPTVQNDHRICNGDRIHKMILDSGKINKVFQGHYHEGKITEYGDLTYYTLPAVCENENAYFIFDI